jgi:hypothetical protein
MLENAQPLCPLHGMPPMERAWSAKPGDVVMLRPRHGLSLDAIRFSRELLVELSQKTGITFVLLDSELDVVPPNDYPGRDPEQDNL